MKGLTEQDLQMIDRKMEELSKKNEELTVQISKISSDNMLLKDWIKENYLSIQDEWNRMIQRKEELSSEEKRIQSMSKKIYSREESIMAYERRVKDMEGSIRVRENSYRERARSFDCKEKEFLREKTKFYEQKEEFEQEKKENLQVKQYIQQDLELLRYKTKMDAKREFEWIYPIFKIFFVFTIVSIFISGILSEMFTVDVLNFFMDIRYAVLLIFEFFGACAGQIDVPVTFLEGVLKIMVGVILPGLIILVILLVVVAASWNYRKRYWDKTSLVFVLATAELMMFTREYMHRKMHINCFALFLGFQIVYVIVRFILDLRNPLRDIWYWRDR